ncbi:MAG: hypothetical protein GXO26_07545 [Crenarchaeota archaeon]|nr:hypothetical protein [Thermoproteota archaeon]
MRISNLRRAVSLEFAKAYRFGLPVYITRVIRVFNLNSSLVYKYVRELEADGIVEKLKPGAYIVKDTDKARAWVSFVSYFDRAIPYRELQGIPVTYYYVAEPPSIEWLGFPARTLVIIDRTLRGKTGFPRNRYNVVYVKMRGRKWRYDWDRGVPIAELEQAVADVLSYDADYPIEQYIVENLDKIDIDRVIARTNSRGMKRLCTFLSFLKLSTGIKIKTRVNYVALADRKTLEKRLGEYVQLLFANGVDVNRGI